jgi:2-dehydropantoate 2-reductase
VKDFKIAVVGIGATGSVLAAALLKQNPEIICVDPRLDLEKVLKKDGIKISGVLDLHIPVQNYLTRIKDLKDFGPDLIFISTKTYHLPQVLKDMEEIFTAGTKIISTHNGLGTEDLIAEKFGMDAAFRMSLNFGVSIISPGRIKMEFFRKPNPLGSLTTDNRVTGKEIAKLFTKSGLDTELVNDIKFHVWKKMVFKCSFASLCAVTDRTMSDIVSFPPTREIAFACFNEAFKVAKAMGYNLGDDLIEVASQRFGKTGSHKDSMWYDVANRLPTEIDYLGGKIVEYGRAKGIPTPYFIAMTNLVRALEDSYL